VGVRVSLLAADVARFEVERTEWDAVSKIGEALKYFSVVVALHLPARVLHYGLRLLYCVHMRPELCALVWHRYIVETTKKKRSANWLAENFNL